jgi:hypothetical protein
VPAAFTQDLGTFTLQVTQLAGPARYATDPMAPQAGMAVRLMLAPRLAASAYSLY